MKLNALCCLSVIQFLILLVESESDETFSTVRTHESDVKGRALHINGRKYGVFKAVPFAEPPIGNLRFKPPVAKKSWSPNTLDATGESSKLCLQMSMGSPVSEDCLYLNVYTPHTSELSNERYPVMFWIHGGGFATGSTRDYSMETTIENLVSHGIVFVATNYRLGPVGFWTSKTSAAGGNCGFLDQIQALKWVNSNIEFFGGDPKQVTIFGESAGGASASLLTYSPLATGLFSKAIIMSGSGMAAWSIMLDEPDDHSTIYSRSLGCLDTTAQLGPNNADDVLACMQMKSEEELTNAMPMAVDMDSPLNMWAARIDGYFLPDSPANLGKERLPIPVMMGATKDEWGLFELLKYPGITTTVDHETLRNAIPKWVSVEYNNASQDLVTAAAEYHYIDSLNPKIHSPGPFWTEQAIKLKSSIFLTMPIYLEAVSWTNVGAETFLYSFDYLSLNALKNYEYKGVFHAMELGYLLGFSESGLPFMDMLKLDRWDKNDIKIKQLMGLLWTNFAKHGNPTPNAIDDVTWERFSPVDDKYLLEFADQPTSQDVDSVEFWRINSYGYPNLAKLAIPATSAPVERVFSQAPPWIKESNWTGVVGA